MAWLLSKHPTYSNGIVIKYWCAYELNPFRVFVSCAPTLATFFQPELTSLMWFSFWNCISYPDMSSTAFIEAISVIDFVAQILNKDVYSRPLSDADRIKVLCVFWILFFFFFLKQVFSGYF